MGLPPSQCRASWHKQSVCTQSSQPLLKPSCIVAPNQCSYPYNLDFDFGALADLNKFSINNLGDPFIESNYGVHSREFEVGGSTPWVTAQRVPCSHNSVLTLGVTQALIGASRCARPLVWTRLGICPICRSHAKWVAHKTG